MGTTPSAGFRTSSEGSIVRGLTTIGILTALTLALSAGPVFGSNDEYVVTRTDDPVPDGCLPADCSLREAVISANQRPGADAIELAEGTYTLSIAGVDEDDSLTGDLDVTDDLTIRGAGMATTIIDAAAIDRVVQIVAGSLTISNATLQNGSSGSSGGAIMAAGRAFVLDSSAVRENASQGSGGGIYITASSSLHVVLSEITGNAGGSGGGVYLTTSGAATIDRSTISGNSANHTGGGLYLTGVNPQDGLSISDSTISGNTVAGNDGRGAGLYMTAGPSNLTNTTISGNTLTGSDGTGAGIYYTTGSETNFTNITIANNDAGDEGRGGGFYNTGSNLAFVNSIIAENNPNDCHITGAPLSQGFNLDSDRSCELSGQSDKKGVSPGIGPLADNGGPTMTHALLPGSPAIDSGSNAACPESDQRGAPRPFDGGSGSVCDMGAVEFGVQALTQGDVDCDGQVSDLDGLKIMLDFAGLAVDQEQGCPEIGSQVASLFGDVDCDETVGLTDAIKILRHVAHLSVDQNEECADIGEALGFPG